MATIPRFIPRLPSLRSYRSGSNGPIVWRLVAPNGLRDQQVTRDDQEELDRVTHELSQGSPTVHLLSASREPWEQAA